jgi:hypothetical protein
MDVSISERYKTYDKEHCWQYDIRLKNRKKDLEESSLTEDDIKDLRVSDFKFEAIIPSDAEYLKKCKAVKEFIERHEWMGTMPTRPTHRFTMSYKGILAGVVVMATPNAFSTNLMGVENKNLEKLISRGACISWSPKNLASHLIMRSIRWMASNTDFRVFTAYSDENEAKEIGQIYQACNFIYLGKNFGTRNQYMDPKSKSKRWVDDRTFRKVGKYKSYAKELGIVWQLNWNTAGKMHWKNVPPLIEEQLRQASKERIASCTVREVPPKHKYIYIAGTPKARKKLLKTLVVKLAKLPYPKRKTI